VPCLSCLSQRQGSFLDRLIYMRPWRSTQPWQHSTHAPYVCASCAAGRAETGGEVCAGPGAPAHHLCNCMVIILQAKHTSVVLIFSASSAPTGAWDSSVQVIILFTLQPCGCGVTIHMRAPAPLWARFLVHAQCAHTHGLPLPGLWSAQACATPTDTHTRRIHT